MQARFGIRILAIGLLSAAYVVGTHWLMTRAGDSPWNVVGVLAPMLAAVSIGAWRGDQRWLAAGAGLLLAALFGQAVFGVPVSPQALYLAQHVGIHLFLAVGFGSTLRAGHTALITTMAARVHRHFPPAMAAYTRNVTLAWTIYFVAIAIVSVALYATVSFDTWAVFANLLTPIAMVTMFAAEYTLRYRLHPEFERSSVADSIRSYLHGTKRPATATPRDPLA